VDEVFQGEVWWWRGPAPFHFVTVPEEICHHISQLAHHVTYGWGMIPCRIVIGETDWTTSLWHKDSGYIVPLKTAVRRAEGIEVGDEVNLRLLIEA
jgi:Domain of unknown function (DUF1905)